MDFSEQIEAIRKDNLSGSISLCERAIKIFLELADHWPGNVLTQLCQEVFHLGIQLINAQPDMVLIRRLVNEIISGLKIVSTVEEGLKIVREKALVFRKRLVEGTGIIAAKAGELIADNSTVVTNSYSSTVYQAFLKALEVQSNFSVICLESRPMQEGVLLAKQLAEAGIKVTLIADSAVFQLMSQASLAMVGGDAILPSGLVNKIGTKGLALAANDAGVPFYALCQTEKIWPQTLSDSLTNKTRPPEELWQQSHPNIAVLNFYFDSTPLCLISGIITERGIFSPEGLSTFLKRINIASELIS
jgi:translation initiation factor 2B subunit (eIF-2B alpha/beta/delta family)